MSEPSSIGLSDMGPEGGTEQQAASGRTIALLETLGFTVSKRPEGQDVRGFSQQQSDLYNIENSENNKFEPAGYYGAGKLIATQDLNGHTITVAFTPSSSSYFDAGIFIDNKYVGANHDFSEGELLIYIEKAMATANFGEEAENPSTYQAEYSNFDREFYKKVNNFRSQN